MTNRQTLMQKHLREYVEGASTQQFRSRKTLQSYQEAEMRNRDYVIDHQNLWDMLNNRNPKDLQQMALVDRMRRDAQEVRENMQEAIEQTKQTINGLNNSIQATLVELTNINVTNTGFSDHILVHDREVEFNSNSHSLLFKKEGLAEAAIATRMTRWRDSSHLKILIK